MSPRVLLLVHPTFAFVLQARNALLLELKELIAVIKGPVQENVMFLGKTVIIVILILTPLDMLMFKITSLNGVVAKAVV
jgi:hypothetical protein